MSKHVSARKTPDKDSYYMGMAWTAAANSKDPFTQVGALIVGFEGEIKSAGFNRCTFAISDTLVNWDRSVKAETDLSKYDLVISAVKDAIYSSKALKFTDDTIYTTTLPQPTDMIEIVELEFRRLVYCDYQGGRGSSLGDPVFREKSLKIAKHSKIKLDLFDGNLNWLYDWTDKLKKLGIFSKE